MVSIEAPFFRIVWFIITSMQLGALLQAVRVDSWHWNSFSREAYKRQAMGLAKSYYSDVGNGDPMHIFEHLITASLVVQGIVVAVLLISHMWPESPTHSRGSSSRIADLIQAALFFGGGWVYKTNAEPGLKFLVDPPKWTTPLIEKNKMEDVAIAHMTLLCLVTVALVLALLTLKPSTRSFRSQNPPVKTVHDTEEEKEVKGKEAKPKSRVAKKRD
mmetsp:Transcript_155/g.167  ORF Transcript_155/g.167 Transcript_155/m.167 type:complete len:216 (+) Transcript_155:310-957(+)|eukprot:CAMPEP_0204828340 /NCGR_PEP_ID=MMETSP1346-20131115/6053_1 /ASSEMBLY_ACC=CAM_ASM_000771 /TAXON_ID=215587 /ORGANISM="Aplanochytrium stocchinoi, Strain GSBS06" /LENGTH=215 /DNA_ID=CAMNT_0051957329 /DNA_START=319 /DNA_END=966 /DNA_ORIENTATION=-